MGLALLTSTPHKQLKQYLRLRFHNRLIVGIRDNDGAVEKITSIADVSYTTPAPYKDLGEMPPDEATTFLLSLVNTPARRIHD